MQVEEHKKGWIGENKKVKIEKGDRDAEASVMFKKRFFD